MRLRNFLYIILTFSVLGCSDPLNEVFTNYNDRKDEIQRTVNYFSEIKPTNLKLYVKFEAGSKIDLKVDQRDYSDKSSWDTSMIFDQYGQFHKFDISIDDPSLIEVFLLLKLDRRKLETLKSDLFKVGCNSISNGFSLSDDVKVGYTTIGYPTHDLYGLDYVILERKLEDSIVNNITEACNFKAINNKVLIRYGGPAFGSDCFPDKK